MKRNRTLCLVILAFELSIDYVRHNNANTSYVAKEKLACSQPDSANISYVDNSKN